MPTVRTFMRYTTDFGVVDLTADQCAVCRSDMPLAKSMLETAINRRAARDFEAGVPDEVMSGARELTRDDFDDGTTDWFTWLDLYPEAVANAPSVEEYSRRLILGQEDKLVGERNRVARIEAQLDVVIPLLHARGVEIKIEEAECCPAPVLSIKIDGVLVIDKASHLYLNAFEKE